ncbi:helix-turn-helix transcriptional regulator [Fusobacterium pseudoperiodonticum]|jgi:possible transcriptional regulator|nr:helix-turn-helix transcriptional regulator [Fusobacterium pseudoperiodonticum]
MNNIEIILRTLMKMHDLTQVDLALKTDIPLPTIRKYLKSEFNPTNKNIVKIENAFNMFLTPLKDINFNDITEIETLEFSYKKQLNALKEHFDKVETEKNTYEYALLNGGKPKDPGYDYYEILENLKDTKEKLEKTISFLINAKTNLLTENEKFKIKLNLDSDILSLLKKNNILVTSNDEIIQDIFTITFDNKSYNVKNSLLVDIFENLKNNLANNLKEILELIDKSKKK